MAESLLPSLNRPLSTAPLHLPQQSSCMKASRRLRQGRLAKPGAERLAAVGSGRTHKTNRDISVALGRKLVVPPLAAGEAGILNSLEAYVKLRCSVCITSAIALGNTRASGREPAFLSRRIWSQEFLPVEMN